MALRPRSAMPGEGLSPELSEALESLRRGTLDQFESEWILLNPGQSASRRHGLGEQVPALVSVDLDDAGDGRNAISADPVSEQPDVFIESSTDSITITNPSETKRQYYRIRAR